MNSTNNGAESSNFFILFMEETNTTIPITNASDADNPLISAENELWTKIFVAFLIVLITIANVLMGCELDLNVVWATCRRPIAPAIGFLTQFFVMPILSYSIAQIVLRDEEAFALGLFVTGCAPAGAASNFWTILFEGNSHLSVTMTFFSTIAALGMMPLWMNLLGHRFLRGQMLSSRGKAEDPMVMEVPYGKIIASLMALIFPLLIGVLIAKLKPNVAEKARKALRPFVIFLLAFVIIFGTVSNLYMLKLVSCSTFFAGLLLPLLGFMFGCFSAIVLRQRPPDVAAIAIETGIQNTGIAIMLLKISFPSRQGDLSALLPVIVACCTPVPLLACYAIHRLVRRAKLSHNDFDDPTSVAEKQPTAVLMSNGCCYTQPTGNSHKCRLVAIAPTINITSSTTSMLIKAGESDYEDEMRCGDDGTSGSGSGSTTAELDSSSGNSSGGNDDSRRSMTIIEETEVRTDVCVNNK